MKLYSREELKDGRIFFDKVPANYFLFLAYFLLAVLVIGFFSLMFIPKHYVVRAQGTIEASDKRFVTPLINAHITEIHVFEGEKVKKGDKLLTLSSGTEGNQELEIEKQINELQAKKEIFNKYEKSLNEKKNYMKNEHLEQEFYGKVAYFLSQIKSENEETDKNYERINEKKEELSVLEQELEKVKMQANTNLQKELKRKTELLEEIQLKIENLQRKLTKTTDEIEKSQIEVEITATQTEQKTLNQAVEDLNDATNKQLDVDTKAKSDEMKGKRQEIKELEQQKNAQSNATFQQLLSELGTARTQTEEKLSDLKSQKNLKTKDTNLHTLLATNDGRVHYLVPVKQGNGLQAFQPIAQIDNGEASELMVESYIYAQDRSKVHVGNEAKIALNGVNQTSFGLLKGKVVKIGNGTISQTNAEQTQLLYQVQISLTETQLKNGSKSVSAKASMPVVASVIYEKESYMEWLLEQLNFMKER